MCLVKSAIKVKKINLVNILTFQLKLRLASHEISPQASMVYDEMKCFESFMLHDVLEEFRV